MQEDMHYYGTYVLARATGLKKDIARVIASSAQYVDDAVLDEGIHISDGRSMITEMSAHKMIDYKNADPDDQRKVWLPFHFLPGGKGSSIGEKMICRKDSIIAREVVDKNINAAASLPFGPQLVGITAHVYADTFAHYGFVGANHELNAVTDGTLKTFTDTDNIKKYIWKKYDDLKARALSAGLSRAFPLGHGAVATFPDRPYLKWQYRRMKDNVLVKRNNQKDFLEGSKALFEMFLEYKNLTGSFSDRNLQPVNWITLKPVVEDIFRLEGSKEERSEAWKRAMREGRITGSSERIPKYLGESWTELVEGIYFNPATAPEPGKLVKTDIHKFYRAIRFHRNTVLTDVLPNHGILAA